MKLSIIITSWNTKNLLRECLRSIYSFPPKESFEVIVVDNNSVDGSAVMVTTEFPQIKLIRSVINTGYAGGNNLGFRNSSGECILLLGSDTEVHSGTVDTMLNYLEKNVSIGAVSCKILTPSGTIQRSCKRFPTVWNAIAMYCSLHFLNKKYLMSDFDHLSEREIDQPDATCIMMRKTIIGELIFDERFTILYNDVDLCQRIKKNGSPIVFLPNASILHHGSQSTKQAPALLRLTMYRNILLYYQLYFGYYTRFILTPILMVRFFIATRSFHFVQLVRLQ